MNSSAFTPIAIEVKDLWIVKGGGLFDDPKSIVQNASFTVESGQFVAVIGPNGAGKTTLFKALIGERPAQGQVLLYMDDGSQANPEDFYDNPEYWMQKIGYIPVDNVLHDDLTVRQALMHVGRLRLPGLSDKRIFEKIQATISKLGFAPDDYRLDQYIRTLSSGERKKLNIAAELLTDPPLLLLDEPTSNLDPNAERDLMNSLKALAGSQNKGDGPTILLITHTLSTLNRCDQVIFIENSRLAEDGPEGEVFERLEATAHRALQTSEASAVVHPPDDANRFERWAFIFDVFKTDEDRAKRKETSPPVPQKKTQAPAREVTSDSFWRQFRILSGRYFLLKMNDLSGVFTLLLSGFIAGFLLLIAPSDVFLEADDATAARQTVVLYVILVVIMGAFNSHREISKEFRIYIHERTKGLQPLAYVLSKAVWMSIVVGVFSSLTIMALSGTPIARASVLIIALVVFGVGVWHTFTSSTGQTFSVKDQALRIGRVAFLVLPLLGAYAIQLQNKELPSFPLDTTTSELILGGTLILSSITAITSGLMLSASVGLNNDRATQLVIAFILFNVILAFSVLVVGSPEFEGLFNTLEPFAASYWGYGGGSSSLSIYCWAGRPVIENFNSIGHITSTWLYLGLHTVVTLFGAVIVLRMQESWTSPLRTVRHMLTKEPSIYLASALIIFLLSWGVFLKDQSEAYLNLTYFDRLFGGNRYAKVEALDNTPTDLQWIVGQVSQSPCEVQTDPEAASQNDQLRPVPPADASTISSTSQILFTPAYHTGETQ